MKKHSKGIGLGVFLLIFSLILFIPGCMDSNEETGSKKTSVEGNHAEFEVYVGKLSECFADISSRSQLFFRENERLPFTYNTEHYRELIKDGITTCENWEAALNKLNSSNSTKALIQITRDYVKNQKLFYKHLLNYTSSGKYVDIQLSNKYSRLAAENMKAYNPELIKALKENNYTYELRDGYIHFDSKL